MKGSKRDRKLLHEHEAFLFVFLILFVAGGFVFWGHDANALNYAYDGSDITSIELTSENSVTSYYDVAVENSLDEVINSESDVVYITGTDFQCNYQNGGVCSDVVSIEIIGSSSLSPGESTIVRINYSPDTNFNGEGVLSIITSDVIDYINVILSVTEESAPELEDEFYQFETHKNLVEKFVKQLQNLLGAGKEKEESIVYIVDMGEGKEVGFTQPSLNFGSDLNSDKGEQRVMKLKMKNVGEEVLHLTEIKKPAGFIVTANGFGRDRFIKQGERLGVEVVYAPTSDGKFSGDLVFNFENGVAVVPIVGAAHKSDDVVVDETPPSVTISEPAEGSVDTIFSLQASVTDDSMGVALVKAYIDNYLVDSTTQIDDGVYSTDIDVSRFANTIRKLKVVATDYSGNRGEASVTISISESDVESLDMSNVETSNELDGESLVVSVSAEIASDEESGDSTDEPNNMVEPRKTVSVTINKIDIGELVYTFFGALHVANIDIKSRDVYTKNINGKDVIAITDEGMKYMIEQLKPSSVAIPIMGDGSFDTVTLYNDHGRAYTVNGKDILSIKESNTDDVWNVEFSVDDIKKAMGA
ncbi:MAG: hypothetical protein Q8Q42_03490 [Nanoarchaeota archaeon]|nr:hypothetical protein [Nanoarchaeota archaeon]